MKKLAENKAKNVEATLGDASDLINSHVNEYRHKLELCSAEMLQYEWNWLTGHIEDLELCLYQQNMTDEIGGRTHVLTLIEESQQFLLALETVLKEKGIDPVRQRLPINTGEHAWEVSQSSIKEIWGMH